MHHEFKFGGEKYEITIAKDGQTWLLGDYTASAVSYTHLTLPTIFAV